MKSLFLTAGLAVSVVLPCKAEILTYTFTSNVGADFSSYVDGSGPFVLNDIAATADGEAFTFDLTISGALGDGTPLVNFSSQRPLLHADSTTISKSLVVTISDVQGAVTFKGFTALDRYDNAGGDHWDVNGQTISTAGNSVALSSPITGPMTITAIDDGTNANSRFEGFQIEVIPEPATLGMVAAFGGCILFIRRKLMM